MGKIKIAIVAKNLEKNGISTVIMNYVENIDLNKFDLTIFAGEKIDKFYFEKCKELGVRVIELHNKKYKFRGCRQLPRSKNKKPNERSISSVGHGKSCCCNI